MIRDCQKIFENEYREYGDKLIIDNYIPKDGTYILVKIKEDCMEPQTPIEIKFDKKEKSLVYSDGSYITLIKILDYYSELLEMNKPIDSSKWIHTNNFMSFSIKKENLLAAKMKGDIANDGENESSVRLKLEKIIEKYYGILRNPQLKYKKNIIEIYKEVEEKNGKPNNSLIDRIEQWIKENILNVDNIENIGVDFSKKDYIKIFFVFDDENKTIEIYKAEQERYVIPNIYNSNDYNLKYKGKIYGLPNDNMGMNPKKTFLGNKARGNVEVPYLLDQESVLLQKKFFDYLMVVVANGYRNIYFNSDPDAIEKIFFSENEEIPKANFRGIILRIKKEKNEAAIVGFDIITSYRTELKNKLNFTKYLTKNNGKEIIYSKGENEQIRSVKEVHGIIDRIFFEGKLSGNYFTDVDNLSFRNISVKENLILYREKLWRWFCNSCESNMLNVFEDIANRIMKNTIINGNMFSLIDQFNLKMSLKKYFLGNNKKEEDVLKIGDDLYEQLKGDTNWEFNDDDFAYAIGQLVKYFYYQSKSQKKAQSKINDYLGKRSIHIIKDMLKRDFIKYNHSIDIRNGRFNILFKKVLEYDLKTMINDDFIIMGFLDDNVVLKIEKNKEEEIFND